jgi:hypothetical protein
MVLREADPETPLWGRDRYGNLVVLLISRSFLSAGAADNFRV